MDLETLVTSLLAEGFYVALSRTNTDWRCELRNNKLVPHFTPTGRGTDAFEALRAAIVDREATAIRSRT